MLSPDIIAQQSIPKAAKRWVLALSGGLDSTVLLRLCIEYRKQYAPDLDLLAVHVNHQISDAASEWQVHCRHLCDGWGVEFQTADVNVKSDGRQSLEQIARDRRYQVFQNLCNQDDLLILGHHLDDQVETLLYRLARGSGIVGLRGMDVFTERQGLSIWRPLLSAPRADLELYANSQNLSWIEDPSNQDTSFDRNFIRHQWVPLLESRWPSIRKTLERSSRHLKEAVELSEDLARIDLVEAKVGEKLSIEALQSLSEVRQKNGIRYWIGQKAAPLPSEKVLSEILDAVNHYHEELNAEISWSGDFSGGGNVRWQVNTYRGDLYLGQRAESPSVDWIGSLSLRHDLELPTGLGRLAIARASADEALLVSQEIANQPLTVKFRQSGAKFRPVGRKQKRLKKWLQDWGIPPWLRDKTPLIYAGDNLIMVVGQGVQEGAQPQPGQSGVAITWHR